MDSVYSIIFGLFALTYFYYTDDSLDGASTDRSFGSISDDELREISELLLMNDYNNPSKYITVNYQDRTTSDSKYDLAPEPLLIVDSNVWSIPTIAAMGALFDNYEQDSIIEEYVTSEKKDEERAFLDLIMSTPVMQQLLKSLEEKVKKRYVPDDVASQRDIIEQIWFNLYSRGLGIVGSSGFEHTFLSEIKKNRISGMHNWLYFHLMEDAENANYLGYLKKIQFGENRAILKFHFNMDGIDKPVDSMFIGTSPELEMALYSLCFITRADKHCPLQLNSQKFNIRTFSYTYRNQNLIGGVYPDI